MTLPARISRHVHVSEREVAHIWHDGQRDDRQWEDCLWTSVVEFLNLTVRSSLPDTLAYAELLRDRSGEPPTGGSNAWDAALAIKRVLNLTVTPVRGFDALWAKLKPNTAAAVAGSMGAFPTGHTLRRWLPSFAGGHAVLAVRIDSSDRVWWCDPLAPKGVYNGQWVTKNDFKRFVDGLPGGGHLVSPLIPLPPDTATETPMRNFSIPIGAQTFLVTVKTDTKHAYLNLVADKLEVIPATFGSRIALPCRLTDDTIDHKPGGDDRRVGYLTTGDNGTFVLATDVIAKVHEVTIIKEVPTGITQEQLEANYGIGKAAGSRAERERIALAESARIRSI